ncbi:putative dtdp-glucose 4,6-dehydratase [Scheffersomyces xylosifermentans]|uniref:putative dtdp-glucose 4,6-dehydratase n=1 Tax=Scheffersomyces xylosifermentans TaxID=1304137 RepID=UPI00315DA8D6
MTRSYDKHVLVTGAAGFIGCNFLGYFANKYSNYHFTCIDKLNYASASSQEAFQKILQKPNVDFLKLDLAESYHQLYQLIALNYEANQITDIVNFAAESSVDRSFEDPLYFTRNNILSTQNLLECYRLLKNLHPEAHINFLHISTDEVYGDSGYNVDEQGKLSPTNPYAASKAAIDLIIQSYEYSYKLPIMVIRPNNIYGPNQFPEKIVPVAIEHLKSNSKIPIHGDGSNKRRYLHVRDFLNALELIWSFSETADAGDIFNVGSDEEVSNIHLVSLLCQLYHKDSTFDLQEKIQFTQDRNYNDLSYSTSADKIRSLGWKPKVKLQDGLKDLLG